MKLTSAFYLTVFGLASLRVQACTLDGAVANDCTVDAILAATSCSKQQFIDAVQFMDDDAELVQGITSQCEAALRNAQEDFLPWKKVTSRGAQFDEEFFDGGSIFNTDDTPTTNHPDMGRILSIQSQLLDSHGIAPPTDIKNFRDCESQAAMCCWVNNRNTNFVGTTDVCSHNMYSSAKSAHVANGSAIYADSDAVKCHGFLWEDEETYKGNLLFKVAMEEGVLSGNVRNIPGAPMCGCLEQMPIVEKAACTQISSSSQKWMTEYDPDTKMFSIGYDSSSINFSDCGEFKDHYSQKIDESPIDINDRFKSCEGDIVEKLEEHAYAKVESDTTWVPVAGRGMYYYPHANYDEFNAIWAKSPNQILRRRCLECDITHMDIYYRRFDENGLPEELNLMRTVKDRWTEENGNKFNEDFKMYSTHEDAINDTNAWVYCNFSDQVGFPRDCGPYGYVPHQWNTFHNGRGKYHVAFYVEN